MTACHHTTCSAPRCSTKITRGWFCPSHWYAVPPKLRQDVLAAYKAACAAHHRAPREEQDRLNRAYGIAYRDCTEHLRKVPPTPAPAMSTTATDAHGRPVHYVEGRML